MASSKKAEAPVIIDTTVIDTPETAQKIEFAQPAKSDLVTKVNGIVKVVTDLVIDSPEMYEIANTELLKIKQAQSALEAKRETVSKPLHQAWTAHNAMFKEPADILEQGRRAIERLMIGWQNKVEAERRAEQKKLDDAAEAERLRLQREAAELEDKAAETAMTGNVEQAEQLFEAAEYKAVESQVVTSQVAVATSTRIAGTSTSYRYGATLPATNAEKIEALKHIIANPQFLNLVAFNQAASNQLAVALKDNFALPGFKINKTPVIAQRGAKVGFDDGQSPF